VTVALEWALYAEYADDFLSAQFTTSLRGAWQTGSQAPSVT